MPKLFMVLAVATRSEKEKVIQCFNGVRSIQISSMNVDLLFDYQDALKRVNFSQAQVDVLRESVKKNALVPKCLTNKQLLVFLHANDGNIDKATSMLAKHYELRKKAPQILTNRDLSLPELQQCFENQHYVHLPPTEGNHLICYHGLANPVAKNYKYDEATTCFLMMISQLISKHGPSNGLILLYDMKNFSSGHLFRNNLKSMKKFFSYIQDASPIKIHEIHIFNTVPFFHLVMAIIKPVMKAEIAQKMHLHSSSLDFDKFYAEYLPRSCLPADFGGLCESVDVLNEELRKELLASREYYLIDERQAALEFD